MSKMTVIQLLNKIANGEQPKTIKYYDTIYNFEEYKGDWGYVNKEHGKYKWFAKEIDCDLANCLNDEVEIIEEEKKIPEKLDYCEENTFMIKCKENSYLTREEIRLLDSNFKELGNKINEVLDYLKSKGE